jgi:nucleoid-associated protein YgaU
VRLRGIIAGAAITLAALVAGRPRPGAPLTAWTGEELAVISAWALAIAGSAWLLAISVVCELGVRTRRPRLVGLAARYAPASVRRLVEVAIVGSCVVVTAMPAGAAPNTTVPLAVHDEPVVRSPAPTVDQHPAPPTAPAPAPPPPPKPPPPPPPMRRNTHLVQAGDNLWRIAHAELVARGNAQPDDVTVARYWQTVIAANRRTLRSGNPNLIFPGELVALP